MAVTTAKQWKEAIRKELMLPSGNVCLVRPVGLDALIKGGKVPNTLLPIIKQALAGKRPEAKVLQEVNEEQVVDMMRLFDIILCDCVLEPHVELPPEDATTRSDEVIYADEVDMEDKQFIFQWAVGGTSDVATFRNQSRELLASLQPGKAVEPATE